MVKRKTRYIVDGKEVDGLDEIPEEMRHLLRDEDGDGTPDIIQEHLGEGSLDTLAGTTISGASVVKVTTTQVEVGGEVNLDELPESVRDLLQEHDLSALEKAPNDAPVPAVIRPRADPASPGPVPPSMASRSQSPLLEASKRKRGVPSVLWLLLAALAGGAVVYLLLMA